MVSFYLRLSLVIIFISALTNLNAQSILSDTITWQSAQAVDQDKNNTFDLACHFVSYSGKSVDWVQRNGARVYHLTVTSTNGSWADTKSDGKIIYQVTLDKFSGNLTFSKSSGKATVALNISDNGNSPLNYTFLISSIKQGL